MASYTEKKAKLTAEIDQMRGKVTDLIRRREALLVDEAVHYTEAAQPSAAAQIAEALIAVHTQNDWGSKKDSTALYDLFWMQSPEVNTAGLLYMAEYRDPDTIEMFLLNGADVNGVNNAGFSVLENVLMGHGHYDREPGEEVFEILAKYNVSKGVERWIIEERCAEAPKYVRDFLGLVDDV
jgi:hypothetical protein